MGDLFTHRKVGHRSNDRRKAPMNKAFNSHTSLTSSFLEGGNSLQSRMTDLTMSSNKTKEKSTATKKIKMKNVRRSNKKGSNATKYKDAVVSDPLQFEREWKLVCRSKMQTLKYLTASYGEELVSDDTCTSIAIPNRLRIEPEHAPDMLCRVEMDPGIMGDILTALDCLVTIGNTGEQKGAQGEGIVFVGENPVLQSFVFRWMRSITRCGRFSLNIEFLNDDKKRSIQSILRFIEEECCGESDDATDRTVSTKDVLDIKSKFGL